MGKKKRLDCSRLEIRPPVSYCCVVIIVRSSIRMLLSIVCPTNMILPFDLAVPTAVALFHYVVIQTESVLAPCKAERTLELLL